MERIEKKRIQIAFLIFSLAFTAIIFKAFRIQVIDKKHLLSRAKKQFFRERKVFPRRAHIFDRNGNPLAINVRTYSIFAIPKNIKSDKSYKDVSELIPDLDYEKLKSKIKKRNKFTWIARKVELSNEQFESIKKIPGVYAEEIPKRLYPNNELASQLLGFVGLDNNGLSGVEHRFDDQLHGAPTIIKYLIDNKGRPVRYVSESTTGRAEDLHLSIDKELQAVAEKALKDGVEKYEAFRGGVGVMDAQTGEILAVANYPTFNPNDLSSSKSTNRKLSFVSDPFEPGSTFKLLTVASALENNIVRPDTNYYCELGRLKVEDHIITEAESRKKFEWMSVSEIIKHSSNVGTTKIAFDLTFPKLKETVEKFGIGKKTGIEIPAESRGIFTEDKNVSPLSLSNISFGQGVATTGIQMLSAFAAFANGGFYVKPTIQKVEDRSLIEKKRIISPKTAKDITQMMIETVEDGTAKKARIPYFKIAAKTSTAQRSDGTGRYNGYIPGFIGYPVDVEKKFVVYAYVDNPAKGKTYYGNSVAGPIFKKVTQYLLYRNKEFKKLAQDDSYRNDIAFKSMNRKHSTKRNVGRGLVPNFIGLDKKSATRLAKKLGIDLSHVGIGVVKSQSPDSGEEMASNKIIKLMYTPPTYE